MAEVNFLGKVLWLISLKHFDDSPTKEVSMRLPRILPPEVLLQRIDAFNRIVMTSIDVALKDAYDVFHTNHRSFEPGLHASWVRGCIKDYLDAQGHTAEFDREDLPFCGLHLYTPYGNFKILKSDHGEIPLPRSNSRLTYYNANTIGPWQRSLWTPLLLHEQDKLPDDEYIDVPLNYVYHWEPDAQWRLRRILLALPVRATSQRIWYHWNHGLPYQAPKAHEHSSEFIASSEQVLDIPGIMLREAKPTGTEQRND